MSTNIKESEDLLFKNYWNQIKCVYNYTIDKYKKKIGYLIKNNSWL